MDISLEVVTGKLNRLGYETFLNGLRQAKNAGNRKMEMAHWLFHILQNQKSDVSITVDHFKLDRGRLLADIGRVIERFRKNETEMPSASNNVWNALERGWHYATLLFGEPQIRTGHLLVGLLTSPDHKRVVLDLSEEFGKINIDELTAEHRTIWGQSDEEDMRPMDGSGLAPAGGAPGEASEGKKGNTALDRFTIDMTADASSGKMDPIVGRDDEIRQIIDVLMRRRQNNPILTGEAGVGKTAVVEGFAQRIASGDVPPQLKGVRLLSLDIGLMQAGASMKGEFEQRLRSVIDEVQSSPTPIILFIDEAHTLIGAGGQAGTGDAANLMKPALARGTLRTVAATTWMEYQKYFEKDPALTRRFQPVSVEEPDIERACFMMRGIVKPMEKHHKVRISDEAIVQAVTLSHRYIPARQLPDKAVSLLDTAAARVAISQSTKPAHIADLQASIDGMNKELDGKQSQIDLGTVNQERMDELKDLIAKTEAELTEAQGSYEAEKAIVDEVLALRAKLAGGKIETPDAPDTDKESENESAEAASDQAATDQEANEPSSGEAEMPSQEEADAVRATLAEKVGELDARDPDDRMIYAHVDEQAVASVVSDWTGIPVGRMVTDEVQAILTLADRLKERVVGQDHGLEMIAKRIETNRAGLDNPEKPIGVFMLAGPSGVGKTETALALAEAIYGGEQNVITISMSEFQEAHTVSLLKGAPPGYVGYGEGGRLTEAVRRKPYSVVLLDEVEKAHPDVHELFFQVFDKGRMEDGSGRLIDFKNTLILLTSNAGTDVIMNMAERGETRPEPDVLADALKPALLDVFPPALLGRIVTIPYYPLAGDVLAMITRLKLKSIVKRVKANHNAVMTFTDAVIDHIVSQCNDPDSGGRMIDNIITNSILPDLSRAILTRKVSGDEFKEVTVDTKDGEIEGTKMFDYAFN